MHLDGATSGISGLSSHLTASVGAMALNLVRMSVRCSKIRPLRPVTLPSVYSTYFDVANRVGQCLYGRHHQRARCDARL